MAAAVPFSVGEFGEHSGNTRVLPGCSPADFVVLHRNLIECDPFLPDSALVKMPKTW